MPPITPASVEALVPVVKLVGEDLACGISFARLLKSGETLASVTNIDISPDDSSVIITGEAVNSAPFDDDSQPAIQVAIGLGVQLRIAGGTAPTAAEVAAGPPYDLPLVLYEGTVYKRYVLEILCTLSTGRKRGGRCILLVAY